MASILTLRGLCVSPYSAATIFDARSNVSLANASVIPTWKARAGTKPADPASTSSPQPKTRAMTDSSLSVTSYPRPGANLTLTRA